VCGQNGHRHSDDVVVDGVGVCPEGFSNFFLLSLLLLSTCFCYASFFISFFCVLSFPVPPQPFASN
jgi:hypothetical protein